MGTLILIACITINLLHLYFHPHQLSVAMSKTHDGCEVCAFANKPNAQQSSHKAPKDLKFYLYYKESIVVCGPCVERRKEEERREGREPRPFYEVQIGCLKQGKGGAVLPERAKKGEEVPEGAMRQLYDQMDSLKADLDSLRKQVKQHDETIKNTPLASDVIASIICFVSTILITVEVSLQVTTYDITYLGPYLYYEFYIALAMSFYPFYAVVIPQAHEYLSDKCEFAVALIFMMVINVFYLLVAVTASIPLGTLAIIKGEPSPKLFYIPKRAPLGWKIDYGLPLLKSIVFWTILGMRAPYKNTYELVTLVFSIAEGLCLVYLAIRGNANEAQLQKLAEQ